MKLFVKNIESSINEAQLEFLFAKFGEVEETKIIYDRITWISKGYGFIDMPSKEEGQKAIDALNGHELKGKALEVSEAEERRR